MIVKEVTEISVDLAVSACQDLKAESEMLRAEIQLNKEKLAYNLGRKRYLQELLRDLRKRNREQDAREARP